MSLLRWAITVIAFPLGGLAAIQVASTTDGFLPAALAGLIAGAVIGAAQWLALRPAVHPLWIVVTTLALALGAGVGSTVTSGGTSLGALVAFGAIAGLFVGAAQGAFLRRGILRAAAWTAVVAASWAIGWFITTGVIIDEQRGFVTFGLSGAAVVTIVTGLTLRAMLGRRVAKSTAAVTA